MVRTEWVVSARSAHFVGTGLTYRVSYRVLCNVEDQFRIRIRRRQYQKLLQQQVDRILQALCDVRSPQHWVL